MKGLLRVLTYQGHKTPNKEVHTGIARFMQHKLNSPLKRVKANKGTLSNFRSRLKGTRVCVVGLVAGAGAVPCCICLELAL